mmetsp:Transcript_76969/g.205691  ORF Transcript_76969/g.205691 Transcript_76969/m.205691 type:complete len:212 (+) Transcript_76969:81-716(+)
MQRGKPSATWGRSGWSSCSRWPVRRSPPFRAAWKPRHSWQTTQKSRLTSSRASRPWGERACNRRWRSRSALRPSAGTRMEVVLGTKEWTTWRRMGGCLTTLRRARRPPPTPSMITFRLGRQCAGRRQCKSRRKELLRRKWQCRRKLLSCRAGSWRSPRCRMKLSRRLRGSAALWDAWRGSCRRSPRPAGRCSLRRASSSSSTRHSSSRWSR